ncbi:unnamed protein product [Polarella glacialis]|uniref:EF-hand domain-containing protein n=1 Tax=Polarella glacialis TaxID=89957 RepID=A0A813GIW2_POLGL|nr:unnamed protein product [Polarella glacialis]
MTGVLMDRVLAIYRQVDTDGDGFISKPELEGMLTTVGMTAEKAGKLFDAADHDHSGAIDFEEFCTWLFYDGARDAMKVSVDKGAVQAWNVKTLPLIVGDVICFAMHEKTLSEDYSYDVCFASPDETSAATPLLEEVSRKAVDRPGDDDSADRVFKFKVLLPGSVKVQIKQAPPPCIAPPASTVGGDAQTEPARRNSAPEPQKRSLTATPARASTLALQEPGGENGKVEGKPKEAEPKAAPSAPSSPPAVADFTLNIETAKDKGKTDWLAWGADCNWIKVPAKDQLKTNKKLGPVASKRLGWIQEVFEPKGKKLHVQATYCFSLVEDPTQ